MTRDEEPKTSDSEKRGRPKSPGLSPPKAGKRRKISQASGIDTLLGSTKIDGK